MGFVNYVEFNVSDLPQAAEFYRTVFDWQCEPFGDPNYLVVQHGKSPGIDTGLQPTRDQRPHTVAVVTVSSIDETAEKIMANGGEIVVEKHGIPYVGYGLYFKDPGGMLVGLHEHNPDVR